MSAVKKKVPAKTKKMLTKVEGKNFHLNVLFHGQVDLERVHMKVELQVHLDVGGHLYLGSVGRGATVALLLLTIGRIRRVATTKRAAKMTPGWSEMPLLIKFKMAFLPSSDVNSITLSNILCSLCICVLVLTWICKILVDS